MPTHNDDLTSPLYAACYTAIVDCPSVEEAGHVLRDHYGLDHATYHHGQTVGDVDSFYVRSTYSDTWVARYIRRGYIRVDPVVCEGFARQLPFDWREVTLTPEAHDFMADAQAFGLGGSGYSIPLIDKNVRRALFSINSRMPLDEWDDFIRKHATDLAELAGRIPRKAIAEIYGDTDPLPQLDPRAIECLTWAARGKEYKAIAAILGISDTTVRDYLTTARLKLDSATIAQAVAKAISLRLIKL